MKKTSDGGEAMEPLKPLNKGWSEHFKVHLMSSVIFLRSTALHLQSYLLTRYLDPPGTHPKDLLSRYDWRPRAGTSRVFWERTHSRLASRVRVDTAAAPGRCSGHPSHANTAYRARCGDVFLRYLLNT